MPPAAHVVHLLRGRLRLRVPERRGDAAYFAAVLEQLAQVAGVEQVQANPVTGSVLVLHDELAYADLSARLDETGLFTLTQAPEPHAPGLAPVTSGFALVDRLLTEHSGGSADLRTLLFIVLLTLAIGQMLRGQVMAPAISLLWYALDLALRPGRPPDTP
jgi:hypothetical protein